MRFLIVLAMLVVAAVVVVLVLYGAFGPARSGRRAAGSEARWETHTESSGGKTTVVVRRVALDGVGEMVAELGRQTVASIPDGETDWETRYHEAMARARSRLAALESEGD